MYRTYHLGSTLERERRSRYRWNPCGTTDSPTSATRDHSISTATISQVTIRRGNQQEDGEKKMIKIIMRKYNEEEHDDENDDGEEDDDEKDDHEEDDD